MSMSDHTDPSASAAVTEQVKALLSGLSGHVGRLLDMPNRLGLTAEHLEGLYLMGHRLYAARDYPEARKWFALLAAASPADPRGHMGLGACLQMEQAPERALRHYAVASMLDLTDPLPSVHSAECLMALGRPEDAGKALAHALQQATARPEQGFHLSRIQCLQVALADLGVG